MQRILIIYNKRSSQYEKVRREVVEPMQGLSGVLVGKYEVERTDVDDNARRLAKILRDGDLLITAGGDATGAIAINGAMRAGKDVKIAVLAYGNFNDLSRTLKTDRLSDVINMDGGGRNGLLAKGTTEKKLYPLQIIVNEKEFRAASCYVTIGMTAEAVEIFDEQKVREGLKTSWGRKVGSYLHLMKWYFRHRKKKDFLPEGFKVNGKVQPKKTSDYAAINGSSMARVMKGGDDWMRPNVFRSETERTVKFWPLVKLMTRSIFVRVPGEVTRGDVLEFHNVAEVEIQAEGEYRKFQNVKRIEVRKNDKFIKVIYGGGDGKR